VTGTSEAEFESIRSQLTRAHWHLDRAVSSDHNARHQEIVRAKAIHAHLERLLPSLQLAPHLRDQLESELSRLEGRLQAIGTVT
jgi:hypothetical protein